MNATLRLAPGVPGLEARGATSALDWFGDGSALETGDRMEVIARGPLETLARIPLPGTPDAALPAGVTPLEKRRVLALALRA